MRTQQFRISFISFSVASSSSYPKHLIVGGPNSVHNQVYDKCRNLLNQEQHIETIVVKQSSQARTDYRIRLKATLASIRFLLRQGLPFRGLDESEDSNNMGNFLELLQVFANQNEAIKRVVLENALENLKLTSPKIQKDIVNAAATKTARAIIYELGDAPFALLVDESRDISIKEQMAIVIRYVDKRGCVIERFLAIEHVTNTKAQSLKMAIAIFSRHGLSISSLLAYIENDIFNSIDDETIMQRFQNMKNR